MAGGIYNPFGFGGGEAPQAVPRRMPQDIPAAPFGFAPPPSKWDQVKQALWETNLNAPIRGVYNLMNADPYTLYTDEGAAGQQAAVDSFDAGGGITVGSAMIPKPSNALAMGIKAYHGSPHSFDKFSMDKIGTGEGAQAYGHGLYFAEKEDIARSYRDALSPAVIDGKPVDYGVGNELASSWYTAFKDRGKAADYLQRQLDNPPKSLPNFRSPEEIQATKDAIAILRSDAPISETKPSGSMYEVNIDADPNAFLDWDKPLSEQPEAVRTALQKLNIDTGSMTAKDRVETINAALQGDPRLAHLLGKGGVNITGDTLYKSISDSLGATDWPVTADAATRAQYRSKGATNATQALKEAGIPGIKYLDAGSRVPSAMAKKELADWQVQLPLAEKELADATARGDRWLISRKQAEVQRVRDGISRVSQEADGTRNFVVFDDKLISIVKKYGIAGASAMLGYNLLEGMNPAQADELKRIEAGK